MNMDAKQERGGIESIVAKRLLDMWSEAIPFEDQAAHIVSIVQADAEDVGFIDDLKAAANLCGSLAETAYEDGDAFTAATGCEAAIMEEAAHRERELLEIRKFKGVA